MSNSSEDTINEAIAKQISKIELTLKDNPSYNHFLKKQLACLQIATQDNLPDTAKKAILDSVSYAISYRTLYYKERANLELTTALMAETQPSKTILYKFLNNFSSSLNAFNERFHTAYDLAKKNGAYPEKMHYFDWLWHEFMVLKQSLTYWGNDKVKELEDLDDTAS